jgi:hypothetical protein
MSAESANKALHLSVGALANDLAAPPAGERRCSTLEMRCQRLDSQRADTDGW